MWLILPADLFAYWPSVRLLNVQQCPQSQVALQAIQKQEQAQASTPSPRTEASVTAESTSGSEGPQQFEQSSSLDQVGQPEQLPALEQSGQSNQVSSLEQTGLQGVSSLKEFQAGVLSTQKRLALTYRSQKKMLLWDVVLSVQ